MTEEQRIGQLFLLGLANDQLGVAETEAIRTYHFGSVWFVEQSAAGAPAIRAVADAVQALATPETTASVRFFVAANQEGGIIQSLKGPGFSTIPSALDQSAIDRLFEQVVRVAKPGARLFFRNFVGHTEIPERFRNSIIEDRDAGERAILRDRSCLQSRIVICRIAK